MTNEGLPSSGTPRGRRVLPQMWHPTALAVAVIALIVSTLGLAIAIVQTNIAREDARAARRASSTVVEGLARKVFLETDFGSVTVSNIGTLPIHDVTVYRTDSHGNPQSVYEFEQSVPGCSSFRWEGQVNVHVAVGFRVVDEGLWLLSDLTGLHRQASVPVTAQQPRSWNLEVSPIKLCS